MSWLSSLAPPAPSLLPSAARLSAALACTAALGTAELVLLTAAHTARRALPQRVKIIAHQHATSAELYPCAFPAASVAAAASAASHAAAAANTAASASTAVASPAAVTIPRQVSLDPALCRRLLRWSYRLKRAWGRALMRIYALRLEFTDRNAGTTHELHPSRGPYLFVLLNQSSLLESVVFPCAPLFPLSFLVNREFAALPFLGWNLAINGVIINRDDPVNAKAGADEVVRQMREHNRSFYMSVEGRRSEDGGLQRFKHGAAVIAIAAQATIVPIISKGSRAALPFGDWRVRPGRDIELIYDSVIPTAGLTLADRHALTRRLWDVAVRELTLPGTVIPPGAYEAERPKLRPQDPLALQPPRPHLPSAL